MRGHNERSPGAALDPVEGRNLLLTVFIHAGGGVCEKPEVEAAIRELGRLVEGLPRAGPRDLRVNLAFDIPGSIWRPNYQGVRTGRLSSAQRILKMQVSVPDDLAAEDMPTYLSDVLHRTVELIEAYVKRRELGLSTQAIKMAATELISRTSELTVDFLRQLGKEHADRQPLQAEKMVRRDE